MTIQTVEITVTLDSANGPYVEVSGEADTTEVEAELPDDLAADFSNTIQVHGGVRVPLVQRWEVKLLGSELSSCTDHDGAIDADLVIADRRTGETYEGEVTLLPQPGRVAGPHGRRPLGVWGDLENWASDAVRPAIEASGRSQTLISLIETVVDQGEREG